METIIKMVVLTSTVASRLASLLHLGHTHSHLPVSLDTTLMRSNLQSGRADRTVFLRILNQQLCLIASFSAMVVKRKVAGFSVNSDFQWSKVAKL